MTSLILWLFSSFTNFASALVKLSIKALGIHGPSATPSITNTSSQTPSNGITTDSQKKMSYKNWIGQQAPAVTVPDHNGNPYEINPGSNGKHTVIFFYPESGSYACTQEACDFRNSRANKLAFKEEHVDIIGISTDSVAKQAEFVKKNGLNYAVLSDEKKEAIAAYNVGRGMLGMVDVGRVTYIIDKTGKIRDILDATVNYKAHSKFAAKWLDKLDEEEKTGVPAAPSSEPEAAAA